MPTMLWLARDLTDSAALLGLVGFLQQFPILIFAPFGGVAADRFNRITVMRLTRVFSIFLAGAMAALTLLELTSFWHIALASVLIGVSQSFDLPSRQSIVPSLVPREKLVNGMSLIALVMSGSRFVGPALAGVVIAASGVGASFVIVSVLFVVTFLLLSRMNTASQIRNAPSGKSPVADIAEGVGFMFRNQIVLGLVLTLSVMTVFGYPHQVLMPIFARDILDVGPEGFGLLLTATGLGAILAGLVLASMGDIRHKGRLITGSTFAFAGFLAVFSLSTSFLLSLGALVLVGLAGVMVMTLVNTSLQLAVPDEFRGRMTSIFLLAWGLVAFGNILIGSLGDVIGVPLAMTAGAGLCVVGAATVALAFKQMREY